MPKRQSKAPVENKLELDPAFAEELTGSENSSFAARLLSQVLESNRSQKSSSTEWEKLLTDSALEMLRGIKPSDAIEGMLAAQMVATHNATLECFERAMRPGQNIPARDYNLKNAAKLSALFARQMETLNKHRGKGQQKVTVEHIHIEAGAQAIVGNIEGRMAPGKSEAHFASDPKTISHAEEKTMAPAAPKRKKVKQPHRRP